MTFYENIMNGFKTTTFYSSLINLLFDFDKKSIEYHFQMQVQIEQKIFLFFNQQRSGMQIMDYQLNRNQLGQGKQLNFEQNETKIYFKMGCEMCFKKAPQRQAQDRTSPSIILRPANMLNNPNPNNINASNLAALIVNDAIQDHLKKVTLGEMTKLIHKNIGALLFRNRVNKDVGKGTAVLISPNLILTGAQNVWNSKIDSQNSEFMFFPGQSGQLKEFKKIQNIFYPKQYRTKQKVEYDYALLKLTESLQVDDFIPLGQIQNQKQAIAIYGYPEEHYHQENEHRSKSNRSNRGKAYDRVQQWGLLQNDGVKEINRQKGQIIHKIPTPKGQGGAPIISVVGTKLKIIGIAKSTVKDKNQDQLTIKHIGRLIDSNLIQVFHQQAKRMKAEMFKTQIEQEVKQVHRRPSQRNAINAREVETQPIRIIPQSQVNNSNVIQSFYRAGAMSDPALEKSSYEARDRHVFLDLPPVEQQYLDKAELQKWITQVCNSAFSISFNYYETGQLNFDQAKIFSSETILGNILRLTQRFKLSEKSIATIDNHMKKKVLKYMKQKYPMTSSADVNKALQKQLQKTNNLDELTNDFLYCNKIIFKFRQNGNYNDVVMTVLNKLMEVVDSSAFQESEEQQDNKQPLSSYQYFEQTMKEIFERVYDEEQMAGRKPLKRGNSIVMDQETKKAREAERQKYMQKVKQYTSYKIGRKISQNTVQFSQKEIQSKNLVIRSSAILRILTKWCNQLWPKFEKQNYFAQRAEPILLQNPNFINPFFKSMKTSIDARLKAQKQDILEFKKKIYADCHLQESVVLWEYLQNDDVNYVPKYEKAYGKCAIHIVKNLHTYIVLILNRLIHGLLKVAKQFYEEELTKLNSEDWAYPPYLLTFKVGDLIRCKCASKEAQILTILKNIKEISSNQPEKMKILKIKNRLRGGTNDILMNVKFNDTIVSQIQLKVNNKQESKFIACSNDFNHYIYELERSELGPISQLCNIWNNMDPRAHELSSLINSHLKQYDPYQTLAIPPCEQSPAHNYIEYISPFKCSICQNFYFHNNHILSNKKCSHCHKFLCVRCQIKSLSNKELKKQVFRNKRDKRIKNSCNKLSSSTIPPYGVAFRLESSEPKYEVFRYMKTQNKFWLFGRKQQGQLYQLASVEGESQIAKFMREYCIFNLTRQPNYYIKVAKKQAQNFAMKAYIRDCYLEERDSLILTQIRFTVDEMKQLLKFNEDYEEHEQRITKIEYADNNIQDISYFSKYENVSDANLDENHFTNVQPLLIWPNLSRLSMRNNKKLTEIGEEISGMTELEDIKFSNCRISNITQNIGLLQYLSQIKLDRNQIKNLPSSICKIKQLSVLNISRNYIQKLPQDIGKLTNLQNFNASFNKIDTLPSSLHLLTNLTTLSLNSNKLQQLPQNFKQLKELQTLDLSSNEFTQLPQNCFEIESLKSINLDKNKIQKLICNMSECKNLELLSLSSNILYVLTGSISNCTQLRDLNLDGNKFQSIPTCLAELKKLNPIFNFKNNELKEIPQYFFKLNWMIEANFQQNKIQKIHPGLANLQTLQKINLSFNKITSIDRQFQQLKDLSVFNLQNNSIKEIPNFISDFEYVQQNKNSLQTIFCYNQIRELNPVFVESMGQSLKFTHNKLETMPIAQVQFKSFVRLIDFSHNSIAVIPGQIAHFINVTRLNLGYNQIKVVPKQVVSLTKLSMNSLLLKQNPVEVVERPEFVYEMGDNYTRDIVKRIENGQANSASKMLVNGVPGLVNQNQPMNFESLNILNLQEEGK